MVSVSGPVEDVVWFFNVIISGGFIEVPAPRPRTSFLNSMKIYIVLTTTPLPTVGVYAWIWPRIDWLMVGLVWVKSQTLPIRNPSGFLSGFLARNFITDILFQSAPSAPHPPFLLSVNSFASQIVSHTTYIYDKDHRNHTNSSFHDEQISQIWQIEKTTV